MWKIIVDNDVKAQGTIITVEPLIVEETGGVLSEHFPTITLDDGRIVNGLECEWCPVSEEDKL